MYVIEVIPLTRGSHIESLTYYATTSYDTGTIITIPVRKKEIHGLVLSTTPLSKAKTAVRRATFSLKKLPAQNTVHPLPPVLIETARQLAKTVPAKLGSILYALLPHEVRDGTQYLESNLPCISTYTTSEVSVLQGVRDERYRMYRSKIREAFAHRGSVLFVVPTSTEVHTAVAELSKGIEQRIVMLSPQLTKKKRAAAYDSFHDLSQAKLIITTPAHMFIDRHDITHIIIEGSRSPHYCGRVRPYLDTRDVLKTLAAITGRQVLMGDLLPRTEDEYLRRKDIYQTEGEHLKRIPFENELISVTQTDKSAIDTTYSLFSTELKDAISQTLKKRKRVFLFAARRGIAPVVFCIDCGHIFRCPDSGAPYSLFRTFHKGEEQRWFLSGTSGKRVRAKDTCDKCGSWRLRERGVGIQHIHDELKKHFPDAPTILFDHTTAKTPRNAQSLIGSFYEEKSSILLGTAMALPFIEKPVALSAVMSLDAARAIPTWKADEELFALLLALREKTTDAVYIQTRTTEENDLIDYATTGHVDQFYTDELELREALHYPPYSVFIHFTFQGTKEIVEKMETDIARHFAPTEIRFYSSPTSIQKKTIRYGLLRIEKSLWPEKKLLALLRSLPPSVRIEINPGKIV